MDITLYIRELLLGHDCVIVPGFGGFIGNYVSARIDKSTGDFFPPTKQISFNKNLNTNDGLLVGKISEANEISFNEAKEVVSKYVTELHKRLNNGETAVFEHIGSFVNNNEGNVQFEPDVKANYCLGSYGLEPFQCLPVSKRVIVPIDKSAARKVHLRKIIWRAAVLVPLLVLLVAVPLKTDVSKSKIETSTLNPLVALEPEYKPVVDKPDLTENVIATPLVEASDAIAESLEETVVEEIVVPIRYQLIVGSFMSYGNAQRQVTTLIAKGFTPEIIPASNGFYRVSAIGCPDIETARLRRRNLLSMFPETWILRVN